MSNPERDARQLALWQRWKDGDQRAGNEFVREFDRAVESAVGRRMAWASAWHLRREDLRAAALAGIARAMTSYSATAGASLATWVIGQIRYAVLSEFTSAGVQSTSTSERKWWLRNRLHPPARDEDTQTGWLSRISEKSNLGIWETGTVPRSSSTRGIREFQIRRVRWLVEILVESGMIEISDQPSDRKCRQIHADLECPASLDQTLMRAVWVAEVYYSDPSALEPILEEIDRRTYGALGCADLYGSP